MLADNELFLLLDSLPDTVLICDSDGTILLCNRQCEELLGYRADELAGRPVETLLPEHLREAHIGYRMAYSMAPRRRSMYQLQEIHALRKDGGLQPVTIALSPMAIGSGLATIVSIRDNSSAVAARNKERELYERLVQKQRMEHLGMLSSGIAHDYRNVLSVILGSAELALAALGDGQPDMRDFLHAIQVSSQRLQELSNQILSYAAGRETHLQAVDVSEIAEEVTLLLQRTLVPGTRLRCQCAAALPPLLADPGQIFQILLNLVLNAREALGAGGCITVRTGTENGHVFVDVEDDGRGMASAERERILEPFFTTKHDGKGIGLAVVNEIVKTYGGSLRISSEVGSGSVFTVLFPVPPESATRL